MLVDRDRKSAKVKVKSTIGADDSFIAAFVLSLAESQAKAEELAPGSAAASTAVTTNSTQVRWPEDVMRLLRKCTVTEV